MIPQNCGHLTSLCVQCTPAIFQNYYNNSQYNCHMVRGGAVLGMKRAKGPVEIVQFWGKNWFHIGHRLLYHSISVTNDIG